MIRSLSLLSKRIDDLLSSFNSSVTSTFALKTKVISQFASTGIKHLKRLEENLNNISPNIKRTQNIPLYFPLFQYMIHQNTHHYD